MPKTVTPTPKDIDAAFGTNEAATQADDWTKIIPKAKNGDGALGDFPPVWNFEEKDHETLVGLYTKMLQDVGPNLSNQYMIENFEDHISYKVWGSTLLDNRFTEIDLGSEVKLTFKGYKKGSKGRDYKDFDVFFRPARGK